MLAENLLSLLPCLTEMERKIIVDAACNHSPSRPVIDCNHLGENRALEA
jgi:hypothetical protein